MIPSNLEKYLKSNDDFSNVALYDLHKDPSETTNLAKQYPDLVKELLAEAEYAIKDAPKQTFTMVNLYLYFENYNSIFEVIQQVLYFIWKFSNI